MATTTSIIQAYEASGPSHLVPGTHFSRTEDSTGVSRRPHDHKQLEAKYTTDHKQLEAKWREMPSIRSNNSLLLATPPPRDGEARLVGSFVGHPPRATDPAPGSLIPPDGTTILRSGASPRHQNLSPIVADHPHLLPAASNHPSVWVEEADLPSRPPLRRRFRFRRR